jgi:hypothetical protein
MNKQTQATSNDMGTLAEDARALLAFHAKGHDQENKDPNSRV